MKKKYIKPTIEGFATETEDVMHVCCSLCNPYWHCDHSHGWGDGGKFYDDCSDPEANSNPIWEPEENQYWKP